MTNLYQRDACYRGFSDTVVPISIPVLVVASRRRLFSVSSAIRFPFIDLTRFIVDNVSTLIHGCVSKHRAHF